MSGSDHLPGEPDDTRTGFNPTPRQIVGAIVAVVLIIFIAGNSKQASVWLIVTTVNMPLWLALAVTALLSFGVGMMFGSKRTKAKLRS